MLATNYFHEGHWGQCLELLSHLCQYGDSILLVTGPSGIGKSTLKKALIEVEEDKFAICDVRATVSLNIEMVSDIISEQLDTAMHDPSKGLLLLIDDAQNLSLELVAALLQLPQKITEGNLHIVLFATLEFNQKIERSILKDDFYEQVHTIEIEPLTVAEVEAFLMHQWRNSGQDAESMAKHAKFKKIHNMSGGIPGKVQQIAEELMSSTSPSSKTDTERNIGLSPLMVGVTVSFGVLFCILALLWPAADDSLIAQQNALQDATTTALIETAPAPEPTPTPEDQVAAATETAELETATADMAATEMAATDPVVAETALVPAAVAATPEVVPAVASTAMSDDEKIQRLEQKLAALQSQLKNEKEARQSTEMRFQQMLQQQVVTKPKTSNYTRHEEHILAMPDSNYTVQLMGSTSERKARDFIASNKLTDKAHYYKGFHKGKSWYVVIYGNYASKQDAQAAIAKLPSPLKRLHPWPRQYAKIHNSIKKQVGNE